MLLDFIKTHIEWVLDCECNCNLIGFLLRWPNRLVLQNTPTSSLQKGKTSLKCVLDMTLNNLTPPMSVPDITLNNLMVRLH